MASRAALYRQINSLRNQLHLAPIADDAEPHKLTVANLQKLVAQLQYGVQHQKTTSVPVVPPTTIPPNPIAPAGPAPDTKAHIIKQINNYLYSLGRPASGLTPLNSNLTQLNNLLASLKQELAQKPAGPRPGGSATKAQLGRQINTVQKALGQQPTPIDTDSASRTELATALGNLTAQLQQANPVAAQAIGAAPAGGGGSSGLLGGISDLFGGTDANATATGYDSGYAGTDAASQHVNYYLWGGVALIGVVLLLNAKKKR